MVTLIVLAFLATYITVVSAANIPVPFTAEPPGRQCGISSVKKGRIIAGVDATPGAWPWMVSINLRGGLNHFCGGSLISPKWVLTAGHCTFNQNVAKLFVVIGDHNRLIDEGTEQRINVKRIVLHDDFILERTRLENDIALLELERPAIMNSRIQLVCLPPEGYRPPIGSKCYVTGWGTTSEKGKRSKVLQQAMLPVVDKRHCFNNDRNICTGYGYGSLTSACRGDSGGPLVCQEEGGRWVQHGVASFVVTYCKYYTGSAAVEIYRDWIKKYTGV